MDSVIHMNKERLITIRESMEFSQRKMALLLNVSKSNYARWETGEIIIPLKYLIKICNRTNCSIDYALNLINKHKKNNYKIECNPFQIGKNLKELRHQYHKTQKEFAKSINTTQSVISEYENGHTLIQTSFLYDICQKYNVSAESLITKEIWEVYHDA